MKLMAKKEWPHAVCLGTTLDNVELPHKISVDVDFPSQYLKLIFSKYFQDILSIRM